MNELELTADRLRQLSPGRLAPFEEAFYALLAGWTDRPVPRIGPQAWGDQLLLIGRGVAGDAELREFRRGLDLSPLG